MLVPKVTHVIQMSVRHGLAVWEPGRQTREHWPSFFCPRVVVHTSRFQWELSLIVEGKKPVYVYRSRLGSYVVQMESSTKHRGPKHT